MNHNGCRQEGSVLFPGAAATADRGRGRVSDCLPRLVVMTDVPVDRTHGGRLLLYRLLAGYPPERLLVVQSQHCGSLASGFQLPNVSYVRLDYPIPRVIKNRLNPLWPLMTWAGMGLYHQAAERAVRDFAPQAVLTVTHYFLWFSAAAVARRLSLPLYLIVHDDWPSMMLDSRVAASWLALRPLYAHALGRVYRQAIDRFCVSPGMAEGYQAMFGVPGKVLYPSRGEDSPVAKVRVGRARATVGPVVAFAGSLHSRGLCELLQSMAKIVANLGGHLDIYGSGTPEMISKLGLRPPVVRIHEFLSPAVLAERIADTAHALVLPASFRAEERVAMSTLFPSKLADYTAIGLPVIIWGPEYSSAARWGQENPAAAATHTALDLAPVQTTLLRIVNEPAYALALARAAVEAGDRYFHLDQARTILFEGLRQPYEFAP